MPKTLSLWKGPKGKVMRKLVEEINATNAKPRLTFVFPISQERRKALEVLAEEKPSAEKLRPLFASKDQTVLAAALHSLRKAKLPEGSGKGSLDYALKDASVETEALARHHLKSPQSLETSAGRLDKQTLKGLGLKPFASRELLASRKPVFATPHAKKIGLKLNSLARISEALKREFSHDFVGLSVVGSITKGYANRESDADLCFLHYNRAAEIRARLAELAKREGISLHAWPIELSGFSLHNSLFQGLFFGDREALFQAQKNAIDNTNPEAWELWTLGNLKKHEGDYLKTLERNDLTPGELLDLVYAAHLLRVPPSLEEMRQIMKEKEAARNEGRQTR